ncbi:NAD(P)-binding domain-containing protein [Aliifodinibius sp. S!AR15-10]|uniref:NADPH-dependent F420 reductase n=1 Tax=Aliifodinibius sp. S!AR15-10 TaxID=2950437 RepID=UPI0028649C21|nr:NAD(P)-binding domain-containing protein [Aliifodinibius sp. S!AR15-10]MDR8390786.1 NAD(P)-binding domain-containing protein [Aliifodinibius sp. S!AR15-10]
MPITKQTIAIIGAGGNMGSAIATSSAGGNYRLLLFDREPEQLGSLHEEILKTHPKADLELMNCPHESSWEADIIILAVPHGAEKELADKIRDVATQKIVVSIANPIDEDFGELITDPSTSAAEELQQWLPNSKVVKAFNTTFAADFEQPIIDGKQVDAFIAGDDEVALQTVTELVETAGFNPINAGDLSVSGTLERMQLLLMQLTIKNEYNWLAGWKILHN